MPPRHPDDPLWRAIAPPADEGPEDRERRLEREAAAKRVSDDIDQALDSERVLYRKKSRAYKVLVLGQSEAGKTCTVKNFQLMYAPQSFHAERAVWKSVIQLNLIRSIDRILNALPSDHDSSSEQFSIDIRRIRMQLSPLRRVEETLRKRLFPGTTFLNSEPSGPLTERRASNSLQEAFVRSQEWKDALAALPASALPGRRAGYTRVDDLEEASQVVCACKDDMMALYHDPSVRRMLKRKSVWIEDMPGFFLDDIERIASPSYVPTNDDVIRARLRTVGVQEHYFRLESAGLETGAEWILYDVGGARTQRAAWAPFFDDVNALIFLAPISAFDQFLEEDPQVNRLEDSMLLWKSICSNKLLSKVEIVLFLNKCDILRAKLRAGTSIKKHIPSYADQANDFETFSNYCRKKFMAIHKQYSPSQRRIFVHFTSVTDTESTSLILGNIRDVVIFENLKQVSIL